MSVIGERNTEILGPQLKLIAQGRARELDVPTQDAEAVSRLCPDGRPHRHAARASVA